MGISGTWELLKQNAIYYLRKITVKWIMAAQGTCYLFLQLAEKSCCKTYLKHQFYCRRKAATCLSCFWQHCCAIVKGLSDSLLQGFILRILPLWDTNFSRKVCIQDFLWEGLSSYRKGVSQSRFFFFNVKKIKILNLQ